MDDPAPFTDSESHQPPSPRADRPHVGRRVAITLVVWAAIIVATAAADDQYGGAVAILMFLFTAPIFVIILAAIVPSKPRNKEPRL